MSRKQQLLDPTFIPETEEGRHYKFCYMLQDLFRDALKRNPDVTITQIEDFLPHYIVEHQWYKDVSPHIYMDVLFTGGTLPAKLPKPKEEDE